MLRRVIHLPAAALFFLLLSSAGAPAAQGREIVVQMLPGNQFSPASITVNVGDTVTWVNADTVPHTSTSADGLWDSNTVRPGQRFSFTFKQAGRFGYVCSFHPGMEGAVTVKQTQQQSTVPGTSATPAGAPVQRGTATAVATQAPAVAATPQAATPIAVPTQAYLPVPTVRAAATAEPAPSPPPTTGASRTAALAGAATVLLVTAGAAAWLLRRG